MGAVQWRLFYIDVLSYRLIIFIYWFVVIVLVGYINIRQQPSLENINHFILGCFVVIVSVQQKHQRAQPSVNDYKALLLDCFVIIDLQLNIDFSCQYVQYFVAHINSSSLLGPR